jgi:hypothetical protein
VNKRKQVSRYKFKMLDRHRRFLRAIRNFLVDERRSQFDCCVIPGTKDTPAAYRRMEYSARQAMRRFDAAIARLDEMLS